jgi:hypothetical protein
MVKFRRTGRLAAFRPNFPIAHDTTGITADIENVR